MDVREATFWFEVDGEAVAAELAEALSRYGFTRVDGYPNTHGGWSVSASSFGPRRSIHAGGAMRRAAVAIARPFRGRPMGSASSGHPPDPRIAQYPIMLDRPGVQPPVPDFPPVVTPPDAELAWAPDLVVARPPDLSGLDHVDWTRIDAVFDSAVDIPVNVRLLAALEPGEDWYPALEEDVVGLLTNSGDLWESAAVTIPFLAEIARCSGNVELRQMVIGFLVWFACVRATDMVLDADFAAIEDRAPVAAETSVRAHAAAAAVSHRVQNS